MQAIRTRYTGPSNTRGARITAKAEAGTVSVPYDHALDMQGNHTAACDALRRKFGWDESPCLNMVAGEFAGDTYWVFVAKTVGAGE